MYNITKGNVLPMKATLVHDEERFPVGASTGLSVRIYGHYRYIDAVNVTVDQEEDGVLYFDIPATLNDGVYGVEVKGKVNGMPWRTATDCVVKITQSTQMNEGSEAVPEGDTYDITMTVQLYKQQSSDRAIEEHNSDETSHPYILGELERIEGEIPTLPEHIVTDANYVHTDNNFTNDDKSKLNSALQSEQDPTVPQWAKQQTKPSYNAQEVGALPANTPLFDGDYNSLTNKPDLSGFITISVNNLVNYYLKSEVYTKAEVANLIAAIQQFHYEIYASISAVASPAGNVLYLIGPVGTGSDKYEEYVYADSQFVKIGDTSIDLSGYYTSQQTDSAITQALNAALANYTTTEALRLLLAGKQDVINDLASIRSGAAAGATAYQKPQGGIPSTDMSQAVQTSLEKANTALQQHQDISGKEDVTSIVAPVNATDATLPITTLATEIGKYYRIDIAVDTLAVTLPAPADVTKVQTIVLYLTTGATPAITFSSAVPVYYHDGFELEAGKTYEVNALYNGAAWVIASVEIVVTNGE